MRFAEAFHETMFRFNLKGADIATASGLTQNQISKFRKGGNLQIESVERILEALPPEAKEYMMLLVLQQREAGHVPLPVRNVRGEARSKTIDLRGETDESGDADPHR